ncbi:MAG: ATP-binding cassette domain-containing protein, partial [Gammaproteobacteria bacterium]|nr:ATP-binding cassette domain-containing protein [Gammaproteobacteria bacterium]
MSQSRNAAAGKEVLVDIREVHFSRSGRPILKGISMPIRRGQVTAIMGGSGCGKTTLLNLVGGRI